MHFSVLAFTKRKPTETTLDRLMAPYQEREWDWYQIGGRWSGYLDGYDPETDPHNIEPCEYCEATGTTTPAVALKYPAYKEHVGKTCIQCHGAGKRPVWPTDFKPYPGNTQRVANVLPTLTAPGCCYAFVSDNGTPWTELDDNSRSTFIDLVIQYTTHYVTILDCHN